MSATFPSPGSLRGVTVGIDIGTTAVKAIAVDEDGHVLHRRRRPHAFCSPAPGLAEHAAADAWQIGVRLLWEETLATLDGYAVPLGVCVSAMIPSLTAVDGSGNPLGEGLLYGDARGNAAGGPPISNGEQTGFLRWLTREYPGARGYWPASTVANYALSGVAALDEISALAFTPLVRNGEWDATLCGEAGTSPEQLPLITQGFSPIGEAAGVPLCGGIIDGLAELAVSDARETGTVLLTLGGTLTCWIINERCEEIPGLWTMPHLKANHCLTGGPTNAGGVFLNQIRTLLGEENTQEDAHELNDIAAGDLPIWIPSLRPERITAAGNAETASLWGLDRSHGKPHLLRAAYETTGFMVRRIIEVSNLKATHITATGGGTTSPPWLQALADTTGLTIKTTTIPETAALGAAFAARITAGLETNLTNATHWTHTSKTIQPNPHHTKILETRYQQFKKLLEQTKPAN